MELIASFHPVSTLTSTSFVAHTYLAVVGGQGVGRGLAARRGDGGDGRCGRGRRDEDLGLEVGRRIGLDLHLRPARGRRHGLLLLTRRLDGWTVIDVQR